MVLAPIPETDDASTFDERSRAGTPGLDGRTRVLVRLAALLALGAPTASVRWAVELASATGATVEALAAVLVRTAPDAADARLSSSASRLALALDIDLDIEEESGGL
jgi:alkylhydroperoxidase/carboxymuconolactone decarboxylase family protein YurZ